MSADTSPESAVPLPAPEALGGGLFRRRMLALLAQLEGCEIVLQEGADRYRLGRPLAGVEPLRVAVTVHDPALYRLAALGGTVGVGEAWMDGLWDASDLTTLVRIFVRNRDLLDRMESGLARVGGVMLRALHALRRNSRGGSRRNIAAHYDLGNELFEVFLDRNLMYSSAIFRHESESLEVASERKLERICAKLALRPGMRVVEIGTGWGGFALHAARRHGVHVTTTTISREQHALAAARIREAGLEDQVTLLLRDYRDLEGRYDRLCSIEMIEAVDWRDHDRYFRTVERLLTPAGLAGIQAIVVADRRYERAKRSTDFIKRWVFPGGCLPSITAIADSVTRATDLRMVGLRDIGPHYAQTLARWRHNLLAHADDLPGLGLDTQFRRLFEFYLAYCEAAFRERHVSVVQLVLAGPEWRGPVTPTPPVGAAA